MKVPMKFLQLFTENSAIPWLTACFSEATWHWVGWPHSSAWLPGQLWGRGCPWRTAPLLEPSPQSQTLPWQPGGGAIYFHRKHLYRPCTLTCYTQLNWNKSECIGKHSSYEPVISQNGWGHFTNQFFLFFFHVCPKPHTQVFSSQRLSLAVACQVQRQTLM